MGPFARLTTRALCLSAAVLAIGVPALRAQESVLVSCGDQPPCTYERVYALTLQGKNSVKIVAPVRAGSGERLPSGRSAQLASLFGLYLDPGSGALRVLTEDGQLGAVVVPARIPNGAASPADALAGSVFEYKRQPRAKVKDSLPVARFVAVLNHPPAPRAVVNFARREMLAAGPHPHRAALVAGALAFADGSPELRAWLGELHGTMQRSLDDFKGERVDPAQLEAVLKAGVEAARIFSAVAQKDQRDEALQRTLSEEYDRLLKRVAIAAALKNAGITDAFLDKLDQIGLARWSRPDLVAGLKQAAKESAESHVALARRFLDAGDTGRAFDEAQMASSRMPCDPNVSALYFAAREAHVRASIRQTAPIDASAGAIESAIRQLGAFRSQSVWSPDRIEYFRSRIAKFEDEYGDVLPLQTEKADFLERIGELTGARAVVIQVERTVPMDRAAAEQWLRLDARLSTNLDVARLENEKAVASKLQQGQFSDALAVVNAGLTAEPGNLRLLYWGAVASAVQRDQQTARAFVLRYLRAMSLGCPDVEDAEQTLFELFRMPAPSGAGEQAAGRIPNWVSGAAYEPGEVFYDPLSGSFHPRIQASQTTGTPASLTEFEWDGLSLKSVTTRTANQLGGGSRTEFQVAPVYDPKRVYMGSLKTAGGRDVPLRYLNCPDYDPQLAQRFTGRRTTRGWAGNPFFHPFLWKDIFVFELEYDELGRIRQAIPVTQDPSRQTSRFSEALTFVWEGGSKRLVAIKGASYSRQLKYDDRHRLVSEDIRHPAGSGTITYRYVGDTMQLKEAECEDNFYDRVSRRISFRLGTQ
jgi:hypothetical protein